MDIVDAIFSFLPSGRKMTPSGWTKFNAVCCQHNGNTADNRGRGGIIRNGEGCSYHCFNCGFKASFVPGRHLTRKMKWLLGWMGATDDVVNKLAIEALRIQQDSQLLAAITIPTFDDTMLPNDSQLLDSNIELNPYTTKAIEYIYNRNLTLDDYDFYWSPGSKDRLIIPFLYQGRTVGYTMRKLSEGKPKYVSEQTPGYVFNLDQQHHHRNVVLVVEGPIDAITVGGVALLGADIMDKQAMLINQLGKKVVVVPDMDKDGRRTIEQAIDLGWSVSFPAWSQDTKDANEAAVKYGRLWTLKTIMEGVEDSALKIKLRIRQWNS